MSNLFMSDLFVSVEQQNAFVELINMNSALNIQKIFILTNIDIKHIYKIAIGCGLQTLYDYGITNLIPVKLDELIDLCVKYSNPIMFEFIYQKNELKFDSKILTKAISVGSNQIIQSIILKCTSQEFTLNHWIDILNTYVNLKETLNPIQNKTLELAMRKVDWSKIQNKLIITNLLVKNKLFEFVKFAMELNFDFDSSTLECAIIQLDCEICAWLLNQNIKLSKTLEFEHTSCELPRNIVILLNSYGYVIEHNDGNKFTIYLK